MSLSRSSTTSSLLCMGLALRLLSPPISFIPRTFPLSRAFKALPRGHIILRDAFVSKRGNDAWFPTRLKA
ncbi:Hypothetical protein FKW44_003213 [Caligus rogercresseyi]|uniref:Secreted protein n=1 Tax=Caligus rogercresseyi TaxID=217165 RepID=A0A7T8QWX0_CALRO|nr:Hypothetical protein FKW44_003213 [Caligus rogercresseyi]